MSREQPPPPRRWVSRCESRAFTNQHPLIGLPPILHSDPSSPLIPAAASEALLELRLLWRLDAFWNGGVSVGRCISSTLSWAFDSCCRLGSEARKPLPSRVNPPPHTHTLLSSLFVPVPGDTLQVHFGTMSSRHSASTQYGVGVGWERELGDEKGTHPGTLRRERGKVLGRNIPVQTQN